jgi:predicted dehydrogenase
VTRLRIAVAGAGVIGRDHIKRIQTHEECELIALADPDSAAVSKARAAGVPLFSSLQELLKNLRPDGVILATPNKLHVQDALQCIAAGVAVLVEKPISDSLEDAQRLMVEVEKSKVPVLVGHHRRHSAILEQARSVIKGGSLGKLVAVTASATFVKPDSYYEVAPWRKQKGAGPILINLVHEVDNLRALIGDIVEVQAFASNATRGFEIEDTAAINLRFANGVLGTLMLSDCAASPRSWEQTSGENKDYDHFPDENCYFIAGTNGSLAVPTMKLLTYSGERSWMKPMTRKQLERVDADPLLKQLAHFCRLIRGEEAARCTVRDATRTLQVALAVAQAAKSGERVSVPPMSGG